MRHWLRYVGGAGLLFMTAARAEPGTEAQSKARRAAAAQVLGVEPNASKEAISKAYHGLLMKYHPDQQGDKATAAEKISAIQQARAYLNSNPAPADRPDAPSVGPAPFESEVDGLPSHANDRVWQNYRKSMTTAASDHDRDRLRQAMLRYVHVPDDFVQIAREHAREGAGAKTFIVNHMAAFMATHPGIQSLNHLAAVAGGPEGQRAVYRAALAATTKPSQVLRLLRPPFQGQLLGGPKWNANLNAVLVEELPRFFTMNPTPDEVARVRAALHALDRFEGQRIFDAASKHAGSVAAAKSARVSEPGLIEGLMNRFARRFLAFDPTLVTGTAVAMMSQSEARALDSLSCPEPFVQFTMLSSEYKRLLARADQDARELTALDCERRAPGLGQKLLDRLDHTKQDAARELTGTGSRVTCAIEDQKPVVTLTLANGLRARLLFRDALGPPALEITPQSESNRPNDFLRYDPPGDPEAAVSYGVSGPRQPIPRANLGVIHESESSFYTRLACSGGPQLCDRGGFISNVTHADSNVFGDAGRGDPDERRPFGALDVDVVNRLGGVLTKVLTVVRARADFEQSFVHVCTDFGGHAPWVTPPHRWVDPPSRKADAAATAR